MVDSKKLVNPFFGMKFVHERQLSLMSEAIGDPLVLFVREKSGMTDVHTAEVCIAVSAALYASCRDMIVETEMSVEDRMRICNVGEDILRGGAAASQAWHDKLDKLGSEFADKQEAGQ
jgi:hypothetical protein